MCLFYCSQIKIDKEALRLSHPRNLKDARSRLNQVWNVAKTKMVCEVIDPEAMEEGIKSGCGHKQPVIRTRRTPSVHELQVPGRGIPSQEEGKNYLSGEKILTILRKISNTDCIAMGLDPRTQGPTGWC